MLKVTGINSNNIPLSFDSQSSDDEKKHVTSGQVATATGATAAGVGVVKQNSYKIIKSYTSKTANALKQTNQTAKQVNTAFAGLRVNAVKIKNQILSLGQKFKNSKILKPLFNNKAFKFVASGIGSLMAILIFISGIGDIINTATGSVQRINEPEPRRRHKVYG